MHHAVPIRGWSAKPLNCLKNQDSRHAALYSEHALCIAQIMGDCARSAQKLYAILFWLRIHFASRARRTSSRYEEGGNIIAMNIADQIYSATDSASRGSRRRRSATICATPSSTAGWRRAPSCRKARSARCSTVSRTVVRAALQMLSFEGLVRTERNRGAFVANPSPEEARQVFASRRLIEPGIAIAACERITASRYRRLPAQLDEEGRFIAERGPTARRAEIKASGDFHLLLASVAGNAILQRFMEELVARSSLVIALYGRSGVSSCGHSEHARNPRRAGEQRWRAGQPADAAPHRPHRGRSRSARQGRPGAQGSSQFLTVSFRPRRQRALPVRLPCGAASWSASRSSGCS